MNIQDNLATGLEIKTSNIKKAGLGLFATAHLPVGIPMCEYKGDLYTADKIEEKYAYKIDGTAPKEPMPRYALWHPAAKVKDGDNQLDVYIDCDPISSTNPIGLGGYINDKHNYNNRQSGYWNVDEESNILEKNKQRINYLIKSGYNAQCYPVPTQPYFMILSIRDIEAGEEIYIDYGDVFWKKTKEDFLRAKKENKKFLKASKAVS
tara:strand:+ start:21358 stop:21978 length:621 start_codon:yes stop_codon:yes gene_type:complete